jgi:L-amino acid N-acyltransferase YncA
MSIMACYKTAIEKVSAADIQSIAAWITATGEAPLISALEASKVRPANVEAWLEVSLEGLILRVDEEAVALGTLSTKEADLPEGAIEACHIIVRPDWRRQFKGTQLVTELMNRARKLGFKVLVGRVVPPNVASHGFLQWLDWKPVTAVSIPDDDRFVWYQRILRR